MTQEEIVIQGLQYNTTAPLEVKDIYGKGRGVFATETICKGDFICEYRTKRVYHPTLKPKYEKEYQTNNEGCYLLEAVQGRRLVFDATRCYDQYGRYINHTRRGANCRYWRPLMVRGKFRVGFIATREVKKGEELLYDYGIRDCK